MIRRSFLQTILAALVAPLAVLSKSTEPKKVESFGGQIITKEEYSVPVFFHMMDGKTIEAKGYGGKLSYHQPHERLQFLGDSRTYFRSLGTEISFDFMSIKDADLMSVVELMKCRNIVRVEVPYIDFPTNQIAFDSEHASGKISIAHKSTANPVQTRMDLSMTIKRPTIITGSSVYKEAYNIIISNPTISNCQS